MGREHTLLFNFHILLNIIVIVVKIYIYFYIVIEARTNLLVHTAQSVEEDTDVQVLVK